jgi:ElaB/YqjD/DUF883 family membrane-anchored ribosome-binding protein
MATTATASNRNGSNRQANDEAATIEQNIERLRGDIAALAQSVTRYGADKTGEYKERANKAGKDLADSSQQALDALSEELTRLENTLASRVRAKPLQSLGIAAGIGVLVALLARR